MYAVVQFVDDKALAVVHNSWFVDETQVQWPSIGRSNVIKRLLRMKVSLPESTPVYPVKKLGEAGK